MTRRQENYRSRARDRHELLIRAGTQLAEQGGMGVRVLEAQFHPQRRGQPDVVIVGYLVWKGNPRRGRPVFQPAQPIVPDPVLAKLRYLVVMTEPDSFDRLQTLRSQFWSFVPIH